jgi:homoserine kinase
MHPFHLHLPATSANLGPGFDALGLAMSLFLTVEATESRQFQIEATGRNPELVSQLDRNLILETYRDLALEGPPLHLKIHNEIPLGMGCGSSAAALLAGVHLANHFGALNLTPQQVLEEACIREGHPDNVAACFHGGMTVSAMHGREVTTATFGQQLEWRLLLALPATSLATEKARALLPDTYTRADTVANIQATALLVAAFAQNRPELLRAATADRIHQPYRSEACPLLPALLPLAGSQGIYSVSLSGAGPSVLLIADSAAPLEPIRLSLLNSAAGSSFELVETSISFASANPW